MHADGRPGRIRLSQKPAQILERVWDAVGDTIVTRADADTICGGLPGAVLATPPELVSWKVGDKMFACFGGDREMNGVSVKTADTETAAMLIDAGAAVRAPYFHKSWVRLPFDTTDVEEARHRIRASYDLIRSKLPAATRNALPEA